MKFGRSLHRYQVLEWAPFYIDYQALKQLYKTAKSLAIEQGEDADFIDFRASLEHNLSKARSFYKSKHAVLRQRTKALHDLYGITAITDLEFASEIEIVDLRAALIELRDSLKQLLWYWLVNFDKILGSLVKFQQDLCASDFDLSMLNKSIEDLCRVNDWLKKTQLETQGNPNGSAQMTLLQRQYLDGSLFHSPMTTAFAAIERDDTLGLDRQLRLCCSISKIAEHSRQRFLFSLLHSSAVNGSQRCTVRLLSDIESIQDFGYHIHYLIIKIGRNRMSHRRQTQVQNLAGTAISGTSLTETIDQLAHIITKLGSKIEKVLQTEDFLGRIPLHYAVQYDLPQVCRDILKHMKGHGGSHSAAYPGPALIADRERLTSLDLAVLHGNALILAIMLEDHHRRMDAARIEKGHFPQEKLLSGTLLANALGLDSFAIVQLLHRSFIDIKHRDHHGNTALHLAVRSGRIEYVAELLQGCDGNHEHDLNAREEVYGWTPLILATARGDLAIVEVLLQTGADPTTQDYLGWRAKDHAAFRGWLPMAEMLTELTAVYSRNEHDGNCFHQQKRPTRKSGLPANLAKYHGPKLSLNQSQVWVVLGALDTYKAVTAVDLSPYVWPDLYDPQREADFYVEVRAIDGDQASYVVQLPILEDQTNKPWRFVTNNARNFKLAFNIYHSKTSAHKGDPLIGSAVALLDNLKQGLGLARESLIRNFTVPILRKDTLDFIGTVTFYFLIMTPFPHPDPKRVIKQELAFPSSKGLPIIGHRGVGQNEPGSRKLQIGENTIESFQSAKDLGASYIEFDVQLTKDDVPVIYHDFLVSETGIDTPLHKLKLEQFMYISSAQSAETDLPSLAEKRYLERSDDSVRNKYRQRSHSLNTYEQSKTRGLIERMKHTIEYKLNEHRGFDSYKGNIRSENIQASFVILEDLFTKLPESVGFDIEVKYPMLFEAHDWEMETYAVEANHLVDSILDRVYRLAENRTVFFSSFSPEICMLLSNKQDLYPVFFMTESGQNPTSDTRADSLQEAICFAKSWRLAGIISRSDPFVMSPQLIGYVKDAGLLCASWGGLNDEPLQAKIQANAGLDAIVTNNIKLISRTLNEAPTSSDMRL